MRKTVPLFGILACLVAPSVATADPVTVGLSFTIGWDACCGSADLFGRPVEGHTLTGSVTYDPFATDRWPGQPEIGEYGGATVTLDRFTLDAQINVSDNSSCFGQVVSCDSLSFSGYANFPGFQDRASFVLGFYAPMGALVSDALPPTASEFLRLFSGTEPRIPQMPWLTPFFQIRAEILGSPHGFDTHVLYGDLEAVATPEPASMLLLGTGLAALGARRWRQRHD